MRSISIPALGSEGYNAGKAQTQVLTGVLALALLVGVVGLLYVVLVPFPLESGYTELALYGANQTGADYPEALAPGETATVLVEIENREHQNMTYMLLVRTNESLLQTREITLESNETWSEQLEIRRASSAVTRINFDLYRGQNPDRTGEPYRSTYIQLSERSSLVDHS